MEKIITEVFVDLVLAMEFKAMEQNLLEFWVFSVLNSISLLQRNSID